MTAGFVHIPPPGTQSNQDLRLKKALTMAGCPEPRVLDLEEGLVLAESWLRSFERTQSDNSGT